MLHSPHGHRAFQTIASSLSTCCLPCRHMSQCTYVVFFFCAALRVFREQISQPWEQITNYSFTSWEDSKIIYEALSSYNPAATVVSSLRDTVIWSRRCRGGHQKRRAWFYMLPAVSVLNQGARSIYLLKPCFCSAATLCCLITWRCERGEWQGRSFCWHPHTLPHILKVHLYKKQITFALCWSVLSFSLLSFCVISRRPISFYLSDGAFILSLSL